MLSRDLKLPRRVHFLGICGRMVGGIALALRDLGVRVSGTEVFQFPPMPDLLREAGIPVNAEWSAENLPKNVDAVITGAMLQRGNPELEAALKRAVPVWNSTAFLEEYFLRHSQNFVVAGTKGKTTTTAMLAWIFKETGLSFDHMIGGQVRSGLSRVRLTGAKLTVLEGDEYRCGLSDPMPKFLRYHPRHAVLTNVRHDHFELYPTPVSYFSVFWDLIGSMPPDGSLTINADDPRTVSLCSTTPVAVEPVGFGRNARRRLTHLRENGRGTKFRLDGRDFCLGLAGRMNALNAALASVAAEKAGVSLKDAAAALENFPGVEGRMELLKKIGKTIIYTDEAYHPLALAALLEAAKKRHPRQRLVVIFEPRYTGDRHGICQKELPDSLRVADLVIAGPHANTFRFDQPFNDGLFHRELRKRGVRVAPLASMEKAGEAASGLCREGDIVIIALQTVHDALIDGICEAIQQKLHHA